MQTRKANLKESRVLNKSQSISVRLSPEDYAYLMRIEQNGAVTQSEKVRELIRMAREQVGSESFTRAYLSSSEVAAPILAECKSDPESRSDVCEALLAGVAETAACVQATMRDDAFLRNLEQRLLLIPDHVICAFVVISLYLPHHLEVSLTFLPLEQISFLSCLL